jgi:hypothetical protein
LRFRVHPNARLAGLYDRSLLLAVVLLAEAQPGLLHPQEQFPQRRGFGTGRTPPAHSRSLQATSKEQIPSAVVRDRSATRLPNDQAFRSTIPALPRNRNIARERKDIIHRGQAADAAQLAFGTFEQDGNHRRRSNSDERISLRLGLMDGAENVRSARSRGLSALSLRCASYGPRQIAANLGEPPASASCTDVGLLRLSPEDILAYLPERRKSHLQMGPSA